MRAIFLVLSLCLALYAQDFRATVTGQVTDPTKATIAGATVKATFVDTNTVTDTKTNANGYYTLPFLTPGKYVLEVSATGFWTARREGVVLMVNEKRDFSFTLELGQVKTSVTVLAESEGVETTNASGGLNFDSTQTSEYPLNGRQVYMLMELTPGVLFTQEQFGATGYSGTRLWDTSGAYVINGGVQGSNQFLMNGAPVSTTGTWQISPGMDAIQEFKVMTNTFDAQFGRTGGGTVNTILKSGTNQWHGRVSEYLRNSVLDANWTQNNMVGAPKGKDIRNTFGGSLGGPIRKDKDFIFGNFEGMRERTPFSVVTDTPVADLRDGQHFTTYGYKVYDPLTVKCSNGQPVGTCSTGSYLRTAFPGNVIPTSRINPIGAAILNLWPTPNGPGQQQDFFATGNEGKYFTNQVIWKWDHITGDRGRLYVTGSFQNGQEYRSQNGFPPPAEYGDIFAQRTSQHYIIDWTRILNPSMVLDIRLSWGRYTDYHPDGRRDSSAPTASQLGMNLPHPPTTNLDLLPRFQLDLYTDVDGNQYTWNTSNQWDFAPSVTKVHGTHSIHFGGELAYVGAGKGDTGRANGLFKFDRTWTRQYAEKDSGTARYDGNGVASLLLGQPTTGYIDWNDTYYRTAPYFALYVHDDWKLRRNLTLNIGLRYDVQIPFVERWNRTNNGFDFTSKNPYSDAVLANWAKLKAQYDATKPQYLYPDPPSVLLGGKMFLQPGQTRRPYNIDWTDIQPRFGVAWSINPKTVVRTGAGIFYRTATQQNYTDGFSQQTPFTDSFDSILPAWFDGTTNTTGFTGPYTLQNPFPAGLSVPGGAAGGLTTNVGNAITFDGRQRPIPRTYQYSFSIQRMLPYDVRLDLGYVGSQTVHDSMVWNADYESLINYTYGHAHASYLNRKIPNPFLGILPSTSTLGQGATFNAEYLLRPFPLFNGINYQTMPWSKYRYDSLQLSLVKRFFGNRRIGGLTAIFSYTFAKSFMADHRLNSWNLNEPPVHELTSYDKPQNISYHGVWDVPVGKRRAFFNDTNRVVNHVISNWNLDWVFTYFSGYPTTWPNAQFVCYNYFAPGGQTPDHWFNNDPTCYKGRASYSLRDTADRFAWIRNPARLNLNATVARRFQMTERSFFDLRVEAFNLTNTPTFGGPNTTYTDPRFGMLPVAQANFPRRLQIAARINF